MTQAEKCARHVFTCSNLLWKGNQRGPLVDRKTAFYWLMGQSKGPHVLTSSARAGKGLRGRANGFYGVVAPTPRRGAVSVHEGRDLVQAKPDAAWD